MSNWISPPQFSNSEGVINLRGRFKDRGVNVSEGLISIVVFRAKSRGETEVVFLDSSKVISAGEKPINILNSTNRAVFNVFSPPPKGPQIFSNTHPDSNKWYKNNSPTFTWKKTSKIEGFSYDLDNNPYGEPNNVIDTDSDFCSFDGIESGIWYFHLKARESGAWGGISHFKVNIDNVPPRSFKPHPETLGAILDNFLLLRFDTVDLLSGMDHFEARVEDRTNPDNIFYSGFMETESPYRLSVEKKGTFKIVVRAFDKAGNYEEAEIMVKVLGSGLAIISGGILLKGIFFPWWVITSFLIVILLISGGIILWRIERRKNIQRRLEEDIKEVEEKLEDIEEIEEKIKEKATARQQLRGAWRRLGEKIKNKNQNSQ